MGVIFMYKSTVQCNNSKILLNNKITGNNTIKCRICEPKRNDEFVAKCKRKLFYICNKIDR